jgi:hypothetical protein
MLVLRLPTSGSVLTCAVQRNYIHVLCVDVSSTLGHFFLSLALQPSAGYGLLVHEVS